MLPISTLCGFLPDQKKAFIHLDRFGSKHGCVSNNLRWFTTKGTL